MPSTSKTSARSSRPSSAASMPRCTGLMPWPDLEPHDRREAAIAQLGLDHRQQVVGFLLVALGVGVARDAEQLAGVDLHAGNSRSRLCAITSSSGTKVRRVADAQEARDAGADRHLHPRHHRLGVVRVAHRDEQVQRQVGDERERMRRVHRQRRDQREDVLAVVARAARPAPPRQSSSYERDADVVLVRAARGSSRSRSSRCRARSRGSRRSTRRSAAAACGRRR